MSFKSHSQSNSLLDQFYAAEEYIQQNPLKALGIGALGGFVIGGGYRSQLGFSLILFAARAAMREAAISTIAKVLDQHGGRSDEGRERTRRSAWRTASDAETDPSKGRCTSFTA